MDYKRSACFYCARHPGMQHDCSGQYERNEELEAQAYAKWHQEYLESVHTYIIKLSNIETE